MQSEMKAIGYQKFYPISNPKSLFEFKTAIPELEPHDLLVKVEATSVNPVDVFTRRGQKTELQQPKIIGWDAYGTVVAVGKSTSIFKPGDQVFYAGSYRRPGSDSEYQAVDERIVGHAPQKLSIPEIAAMPLTSLTAWEALFEQMDIKLEAKADNAKKSILIINGAGGVGSIATQLAHLAGLQVLATAGNTETKQWELDHGVDYVIDYHDDVVKQVQAAGFEHVNYILELTNLDAYWPTIVKLIAPFGKIVSTTGSGKNLDFQPLKRRMVTFGWEWMYAKSWYQTPNMISQHQILEQVSQLLDEGKLQSTLTKKFSPINAENLRNATALVESKHMIGKVVVKN
ncbi:zinc-binding alcohol dehydrogenase family protein [Fructilactobacillus frigidiflavus]|uniref:zinc-binding alcohol dehydrogenase family protein n=1 Tax=Fructilactobacillus frigidiflavus TaxID=3242688 RepID=UPI00375817BB